MADYLAQAQNNFSQLDLGKIQQLVNSISDNAERATRFVMNPDGFIRDELSDEKISPHLHCHVRIGDRIFPREAETTTNQIVVTMRVHMTSDVMSEVSSIFDGHGANAGPIDTSNPCDKIGCGECLMVVMV
ncbi:hypothetical protein [Burkholderia cepacia]|uniref:hypothetical protein n=1 Tax=Burkholderia cepacia TaxID=292 RepID=UPI00158CA9F7|nr:hypothetical protein [Burkholderia cepacia]